MGTIASPVFRQVRVNARARAAAPFARRAQGRVLGQRLTANLYFTCFPPQWDFVLCRVGLGLRSIRETPSRDQSDCSVHLHFSAICGRAGMWKRRSHGIPP